MMGELGTQDEQIRTKDVAQERVEAICCRGAAEYQLDGRNHGW